MEVTSYKIHILANKPKQVKQQKMKNEYIVRNIAKSIKPTSAQIGQHWLPRFHFFLIENNSLEAFFKLNSSSIAAVNSFRFLVSLIPERNGLWKGIHSLVVSNQRGLCFMHQTLQCIYS